MDQLKLRNQQPEKKIQDALVKALRNEGWYVKRIHSNMLQAGLPDLFASHSRYGMRWIEVKLPDMKGSKFTGAQLENFPKMVANGAPVWILTGATKSEIDKLKDRCNFWVYYSKKYLKDIT